MRVFAIGDIHGEIDKLKALHEQIARFGGADARIIHVGDLLDRGPDSRAVVDYLREGLAKGRDWIVLKGNHDRFLPKFLYEPEWIDPGLSSGAHWVDHEGLGAAATLASYGVNAGQERAALHEQALKAVPADHAQWLDHLPLYHEEPGALFVHAGIRPGIAIEDQREQDLLWIRQGFLDNAEDHGRLVVHGHTPVKEVQHLGNRLAIDTGAVFGGKLSAVALDDKGVSLLGEVGFAPLLPAMRVQA